MEQQTKKGINLLSLLIGVVSFMFTLNISLSWADYYLQTPLSLFDETSQIRYIAPFAAAIIVSAIIGIITIFLTNKLIKTIA